MWQSIQEWTKWNLWKTAFKKCCLPQISLGPFLNNLSQIFNEFLKDGNFYKGAISKKHEIWINNKEQELFSET